MRYWPSKTAADKHFRGLNWAPTLGKLGDPIIVTSEWARLSGSATVLAGEISADGRRTITRVQGGSPNSITIFRNTVTLSDDQVLTEDVFQKVRAQPPPDWLAISDFQRGVYKIGLAAKALGQLWKDDSVAILAAGNWDVSSDMTWDPSKVVLGTGLTHTGLGYDFNNPVATPELIAALNLPNGITMLLDYTMASNEFSLVPNLSVEVDDPAYASRTFMSHQGDHHIDHFTDRGGAYLYEQVQPLGQKGNIKMALTITPGLFAYSINDQAAKVSSFVPGDMTGFIHLWLRAGLDDHNMTFTQPSSIALRSVKFCAPIENLEILRAITV